MFGKVGTHEAYKILNRKIYAAIAGQYPQVAGECARQLREKTGETVSSNSVSTKPRILD
jgi:hypothetical protein